MSFRIAVVSDIHHGAESHTKKGPAALPLLAEVLDQIRAEAPDLVLDLGDRISDKDPDTDAQLQTEVAQAFANCPAPVHHICGNHDRDNLSVGQNEAILGQPLASQVIDAGDWNLAIWRAEAKLRRSPGEVAFDLPEQDLLWLSRMAQHATQPTLVVSHVPISNHAQIGNYYFQNRPDVATYPQHARARAALEQSDVPMVMLSGHVHWNTCAQINGIWHLTQQSLTESFTTQGEPAGAWGLISLGETVQWEVRGRDPFAATLTPTAGRWTPPLA